MLRQSIVIGGLLAATGAAADPVPLTSDALKETVAGTLVEIDTPLGTKIPIRFSADGMVSGESQDLAPVLGSAKDRGRWWVDGDKLCSKWFRWFDAEVRCSTLKQDGTRLYWTKDDGETGTATIIERGKSPQPPKIVEARVIKKPAPVPAPPSSPATSPPAPAPAPQPPVPTVLASAPDPSPNAETPKEESGEALRFSGMALLGSTPAAAATVDPPPAPKADTPTPVAKLPAPRETATRQPPKKAVATIKKPAQRQAYTVAAAGPATSQLPPARPTTFYRVTGVDDDDSLNVRSGPSENHAPVAAIPASGRRVEISGRCFEAWCPIRYGRITGWVNRLYLVAEEGSGRQDSSSPVYFAQP